MKILSTLFTVCFVLLVQHLSAQTEDYVDTSLTKKPVYIVTTYNGGEFIGELIDDNEKEIILNTKDRGRVAIPKYEVKEFRPIKSGDISSTGEYRPDQIFATRYFIATNGLPIEKGENYVIFNLWGPGFHFGISDNLSVGISTSWLAVPVVGNIKYTIPFSEKQSMAVGLLAGHTLWYASVINAGGILPYAAFTQGNRKSNFTISGGYGYIAGMGKDQDPSNSVGAAMISVAGMTAIGRNVSFVFESVILPEIDGNSAILIIPGLRFQSREKSAFQFGLSGSIINGEVVPLPIPTLQWFRKF